MGERGGSNTRGDVHSTPLLKLPSIMTVLPGLRRRCSGVTMMVLGLYGSVGVSDGDSDRDAGRLLLGSG